MAQRFNSEGQIIKTSFEQRKDQRIAAAAAGVKYAFQVVAPGLYEGEIVGTFSTRADAERFAFAQRGPLAGNTSAWQALCAKHPKELVPMGPRFNIRRIEA